MKKHAKTLSLTGLVLETLSPKIHHNRQAKNVLKFQETRLISLYFILI